MTKNTKVVHFQKELETKHTVRFAEVQIGDDIPIIGSLYVKKWFIGRNITKLTVTLEM